MKDLLSLIKYLIKPRRLVDVYYYLREYRKWSCNGSRIGLRSYTHGSILGDTCVVGCDNSIINSIVGRHSNIKYNCKISSAKIGKFCVFAQNVTVGAGKHPVHFASTNFLFYSNTKSFKTFADGEYFLDERDVINIGHDVWFGANSSVVGNVNIGSGAVIAYGAVVTKDVPPYAVVGGVPAKIIKMRFPDEVIERLLEIKWWNLSDAFFAEHFKLMHDPMALINFYDQNKDYVESFRISND